MAAEEEQAAIYGAKQGQPCASKLPLFAAVRAGAGAVAAASMREGCAFF